ncbi:MULTISPECIES: hypothetical protein [Enterovibrio]|uniref:hypothetical protein n=1 Tax=Enterovibrio TaxID=188143 RepID=UPI00031871C8|nr:hypothetical protein [Enterovibrio norvegicus]
MAKWEQWLKNDTNRKDKVHSKFNEEFGEQPQRDKKRRKPRPSRTSHEEYPFD